MRSAVNFTVHSRNIVVSIPKPVQLFLNFGARHGLKFFGWQCHLKNQPAAIYPVQQAAQSRHR